MLKKNIIPAALLLALWSAALGFAPASAVSTVNFGEVINVNTTNPTTLPDIQVKTSQNLLMNVNNNVGCPIVFSIPDAKLQYQLDVAQGDTYYVDVAQLPNIVTKYNVLDSTGNVISQGQIIKTDVASDLLAVDLSRIINYQTGYRAPTKPEPVYSPPVRRAPARQMPVRGFW